MCLEYNTVFNLSLIESLLCLRDCDGYFTYVVTLHLIVTATLSSEYYHLFTHEETDTKRVYEADMVFKLRSLPPGLNCLS